MLPHQIELHQLLTEFQDSLACPRCETMGSMRPNWDAPYIRLVCYRSIGGIRCHEKMGEARSLLLLEGVCDAPRDRVEFIRRCRQRRSPPPPSPPRSQHGHAPTLEATPTDPSSLASLTEQLRLIVAGLNCLKDVQTQAARERLQLEESVANLACEVQALGRQLAELRAEQKAAAEKLPIGMNVDLPPLTTGAPANGEPAAHDPVPAPEPVRQARRSTGRPSHPARSYAAVATSGALLETSRPVVSGTKPPAHPAPAPRVAGALQSLLVAHQRPPVRFTFVYISGIRRQPIKAIISSLKQIGVSPPRLQLSFIEDSNVLMAMLPETNKAETMDKLRQHGIQVQEDLPPEQVAAVNSSKLANLPQERREALASKRTALHLRRLALKCPIRQLQRFMCGEIRRMGATPPSRRELDNAERTRREKQEEQRRKTADPEQDDEGWTPVRPRRARKAKSKNRQPRQRQGQDERKHERRGGGDRGDAGPEGDPQRKTQASGRDASLTSVKASAADEYHGPPITGPKAVKIAFESVGWPIPASLEEGPDIDPSLFEDGEEEWLRNMRGATGAGGWVSEADSGAENDGEDLNQDLVSDDDDEGAGGDQDLPTKTIDEDEEMTQALIIVKDSDMPNALPLRDAQERVAAEPAPKKTRKTSTAPQPAAQ